MSAVQESVVAGGGLNPELLRRDFPVLEREVHGSPLVYLDNAASTQKPQAVIDAELDCYRRYYANVHRGVHTLSQESTAAFEGARGRVRRFLNAPSEQEIVFVRGTTEAINLVAHSFVEPRVKPGDEIVVTHMEHHSNIVPWQLLCERTGAVLRVVPISDAGEFEVADVEAALTARTRFLSLVHVSNVLGTVNPVREIVAAAKSRGVPVLVDGAQATPHMPVDVQELDVDFYAFSGHKIYGPTGIGVLYGRYDLLAEMVPYQGGGDMIRTVSFAGTEYADPPARFEAGTPNIAGAVGLGRALEWFMAQDREALAAHEDTLLARCTEVIEALPGLRIIGTAEDKVSVVSFVADDVHAHDLGTILDHQGVAIRTGHHCTMPLLEWYGVPATARASMAFYNTHEEIEILGQALERALAMFRD